MEKRLRRERGDKMEKRSERRENVGERQTGLER